MPAALSFSFPLPLPASPPPALSPLFTGNLIVDHALGGIPRGTLTEICGAPSAGSTGLLLSILRQATANGEFCVWIDVQDTFDPGSASSNGLELGRVLWVRCARNLENALKAADLLTRAGGFGVVALDLAGTSSRTLQRIPLASWFRLRHGAEQSGTALIVASHHLHTGSSKLQIEIHPEKPIWSATLLQGIRTNLKLPKRSHLQAASFCVER